MKNVIRWSMGLMLSLVIGAPMVSAQQQGHQRMMMPRVPADKLEEARALTSPLSPSPDIVEQGKAIYEGKGGCVNCHGASGRGDGPGAATLKPPPRVFRSHGFWRHRSEGEIFWVIKYGSPGTGMIPFGGMLSDEEIWTVMQYERSFAGGPHGGRGGPQGGGRHRGRGMMRQHGNEEGYGMRSGAMGMAGQQVDPGEAVMDKAAKAKAATIGIAQAVTAANNHVPGTVLEVEFQAEEDQGFWEVEIVTDDGKMMEVKVDSQTGAILSSEEEKPKDDQKPMRHGKGKKHHGLKGQHEGCEGEGMGGGHMSGGGMKGGSMAGECMKGHKQE